MRFGTQNQIARAEQHWGEIAGEQVRVELIGGCIYGFCSELGARRLQARNRAGRVDYSANLKTWFYVNQ